MWTLVKTNGLTYGTSQRAKLLTWWLLTVSSFTLVGAAQGQDTASGRLRGQVLSRSALPIVAVEVTALQIPVSALTDSAGRFVLTGLPPGEHVIRVRRVGFRAQYLSAGLAAGETKDVTVVLEPGAYELPEIEVSARAAKPIEYAFTTRYDDFFRRQRVGLGHFITRADIERKNPWRTPSLLHGIPGARIRFRHAGMTGTDVWFTRCVAISVWIDGVKQNRNYQDVDVAGRLTFAAVTGMLLDRVLPSQIEMVEVYTGPAQMPAEFIDDSCAAIVIWTR